MSDPARKASYKPSLSEAHTNSKQEHFELSETSHQLDTESNISVTSFKRWHRYLQTEHEISQQTSFGRWRCCYKFCKPCRWFDSVAYDTKICKCCLTFKTFKSWGTILLAAIFFYIFMYSLFKTNVFPGGTIFFLFLLSLTAYVVGYSLVLVGLPPLLGHFGVGILFGNVPQIHSLNKDDNLADDIGEAAEKILILIAIIRAGLLLDLTRVRHHLVVILLLGTIPFLSGTLTVIISCLLLSYLPWEWSVFQGSLMNVVSLASMMTIMTKNKLNGYGEDKDLAAVLIAASVINVVCGLLLYTLGMSYILADGPHSTVMSLLIMLRDFTIALFVGIIAGLMVGFFPDKRNTEAAALRIIMLGLASFSLANIFYEFRMVTEAFLSSLVLSIVAINIWEELGWHKENNPVLYFYSLAYYISQPVVVSLLGFTINFQEVEGKTVGMGIGIFFSGLFFRLVSCFLVLLIKSYPTNWKEKTFIQIAWSSVGTFQALLAFSIEHIIPVHFEDYPTTKKQLLGGYAKTVKQNTVIAILLTTPIVCFMLTGLSSVLLKKHINDAFVMPPRRRRATSIKNAGIGFPEPFIKVQYYRLFYRENRKTLKFHYIIL